MWAGGKCNIDRVSAMLKVNIKRVKTPKRYRIRGRNSDSILDNVDREVARLSVRANQIYDELSVLESQSYQNYSMRTKEGREDPNPSSPDPDPIQILLLEVRKLSKEVQEIKENQQRMNERLDSMQPNETS